MDGLRGISGHYWERQRSRYANLAFACRFGGQDVYRLTGRDPATNPLTAFEFALFVKSTEELVEAEFSPREPTDYAEPPTPSEDPE